MVSDKIRVNGPCLRVLIVDDNAAAAQTTGWMIEIAGHDYRLAHHAGEALAVAGEFLPDAVLLDIGLPGMNGFDLCRQMRAQPELSHAVFIALTGWSGDSYRHMASDAGFAHYLLKPLYLATLENLLNQIQAGVGVRD